MALQFSAGSTRRRVLRLYYESMRVRTALFLAAASTCALRGQTTQGLITGTVRDSVTARPLAGVSVHAACFDPPIHRAASTNASGMYSFPDLPPGTYSLTAKRTEYQSRESYERVLSVAGYILADFELRPLSDVWEKGRYRSVVFRNDSILTYFGPDLDPAYSGTFEPERAATGQLEPSVSEVIDPRLIATLPLTGRDVYTAIVLLPGVTSDTTTVRSIGVSANGQRPTSSNFLLDGIDDNNHVITGPLLPAPPEAVQEYRVSTNNFSAEYGGATGYIANAVTRSGGAETHGVLYANGKTSVLNANTFQRNAQPLPHPLPRRAYDEIQPGFWAGGPLPWRRWAWSSALEYFHAHSASDSSPYYLPTEAFYRSLPQGSFARGLLDSHKPVIWGPGDGDAGEVLLAKPIALDRLTGIERLDYAISDRHRLLLRFAGTGLTNPNFFWNPYGAAPFKQNSVGGIAAYTTVWSPAFTTEVRFGIHRDRIGWTLVNSDLPGVAVSSTPMNPAPMLPSSCCDQAYEDRSSTASLDAGATWLFRKSVIKTGGGWAGTWMKDRFGYEPYGVLKYADTDAFKQDQPYSVEAIVSRYAQQNGQITPAATTGRYSRSGGQAYLQEDYRASPNLTLNAGVRYQFFGAPWADADTRNTLVSVAGGVPEPTLFTRTGGKAVDLESTAWAVRFGASYSPAWLHHSFVLRAGFGTFREGMFDNLWLPLTINDIESRSFPAAGCPVAPQLGGPPPGLFARQCSSAPVDFLDLTAFRSPLRIPAVKSSYMGAQFQLARNWTIEVDGLGSVAANLFSTDAINRSVDSGRPGSSLPDVYYRENDAQSHYAALTASVRFQATRAGARVYYTWSHSMDNQSDPLLGEFFDLGFSNQNDRGGEKYYGAFTLEGNPEADTGNADFDQRHNFAAFSYWDLPAIRTSRWALMSEGWRISQTFVARSGLPYSVYAGIQNCHPVCNTRADLVNSAILYAGLPTAGQSPGTVRLLNPEAFSVPAPGTLGNTGRNAFPGPGFWNLDLSVARTFSINERLRIEVRADAFNLLNHANLQPPASYWGLSA